MPAPFIKCADCKVETNDEHVGTLHGMLCRLCWIRRYAPTNADSVSARPLYSWQK